MLNDNEVSVVNVRLVKEPSLYSPEPIHSPQDVLDVIAKELSQYDREVFAILNLKSNGQVINLNIASVGTLDAAMVSPREIFKASILSNAGAFIAVHNHPSGNLEPSQEDFATTKRLQECGDLLGVRMLDHIIVGGGTGRMMSFNEEGYLNPSSRHDWER